MESAVQFPEFPEANYHPVVDLSAGYEVLDLSRGGTPERTTEQPLTVGRYDEDRSIYTTALFAGGRSIHMGIDIGAPVGTPVYAFASGDVFCQGVNAAPGDYGPTLITHHVLGGRHLWVLHGHLSSASLAVHRLGERFEPGELLGWIGDRDINGGWPPHVHIQLCVERPETHDMPGAVTAEQRSWALRHYPDPRAILGPLY
jgi:murein DD-endopeptidase MepM/ murein hydrolase activator NlpD